MQKQRSLVKSGPGPFEAFCKGPLNTKLAKFGQIWAREAFCKGPLNAETAQFGQIWAPGPSRFFCNGSLRQKMQNLAKSGPGASEAFCKGPLKTK